jgi:hypothetical protein
MYRSVIFAVLALVGGCAGTLPGPPGAEGSKAIAQAKTVGVISAVGHTFALQKMGITVFGNELNEVPIGAWGIDDAVAGKVSALLSKRYAVKRVSYASGDLEAKVDDVIRKVAASSKHDLYIVVTRTSAPIGTSNQIMTGLGMIELGGVLFPDNVKLFAVTAVQVYDGRTLERLAWQRTGSYPASMGIGGDVPQRSLDRSWWPATPQAVHNEKLKVATRALVSDGLDGTILEVMGMDTGRKGKPDTWSPFKK